MISLIVMKLVPLRKVYDQRIDSARARIKSRSRDPTLQLLRAQQLVRKKERQAVVAREMLVCARADVAEAQAKAEESEKAFEMAEATLELARKAACDARKSVVHELDVDHSAVSFG